MTLVPPFGANGVEFNKEYTEMYVANTADHSIVEVPTILNVDGSVSVAGPAAVLTTGINAPDGIAVDLHDNLWAVANQEDEIDVIDPNAINSKVRLRRLSPNAAISRASARKAPFKGCCSRLASHSASMGKPSTFRTWHYSCQMPGCLKRRSTRPGR